MEKMKLKVPEKFSRKIFREERRNLPNFPLLQKILYGKFNQFCLCSFSNPSDNHYKITFKTIKYSSRII